MGRSRQKPKELLDLVFRLAEACLKTLKPNAWKLVTFVATRVLLAARQEWGLRYDLDLLLKKDISAAWLECPDPPPSPQEDPRFEVIPSDPPDALFPTLWAAPISLTELCCGIGLSRSSTVAAVREALSLGVLKKTRQRSPRGDWMPSLYWIDWNWVWDVATKAEKKRRRRELSRRSQRHRHPGNASAKSDGAG